MEFPPLIRELAWNNKVIYHCIELYCHGTIVSKEEAYCQMVKKLATTYNQMVERLTNEAHMKTVLYVKPQ